MIVSVLTVSTLPMLSCSGQWAGESGRPRIWWQIRDGLYHDTLELNPRLSSFITVEQFGVFFFLIAVVLEVEDGKVSGLGSFPAHVVTPSEA